MPDPLFDSHDADLEALRKVLRAAEEYLVSLPTQPALPQVAAGTLLAELGDVPRDGIGAVAAMEELCQAALLGATTSTGPRYFDFVIGGATPAAMAADWLTSLLDQNAAGPGSAAWVTELEARVIRELVVLFGLRAPWSGVLTTSSMLGSFTALSCATRWWASQHGVDVSEEGLSSLPPLDVFASPLVHPTVQKALQMMGHGRRSVAICRGDAETDRLDLELLRERLCTHDGPAIVVATAGDASAGRFDPLDDVATIASECGAWLHVDAAFGIYASLASDSRHLLEGIDRADSIAADTHKWMNVPYDSGFCLVRDPAVLESTFGMPPAAYLPGPEAGFRGFAVLGPDSSRRARALPIWATLAAYGADGLTAMVDRHLWLARHLAKRVDAEPDLELLCPVSSCIVCFRWNDGAGRELDNANRAVASAIQRSGEFALGTTRIDGALALRAAVCNWRTRASHLDGLVDHVLRAGQAVREAGWA